MVRESTQAGMLGQLVRFTAALAANAADFPHLEGTRVHLEKLVTEAQAAAQQQATFIAGKQESSKLLQTLLTEGLRVATGLQRFLMQHYGLRSEKLAEFGLQPFRGRRRKVTPESPEPPKPAPPVTGLAAPEDSEA